MVEALVTVMVCRLPWFADCHLSKTHTRSTKSPVFALLYKSGLGPVFSRQEVDPVRVEFRGTKVGPIVKLAPRTDFFHNK